MQEYYTTSEAADIFGVTAKTMRNWDKEDVFVPARREGEDRLYSRQQIEAKLGKTIEEAKNPIWALSKEGVASLLWLGSKKAETITLDNKSIYWQTLRERFQTLYLKLVQKSTEIHRNTGISGANWILASPEMASWFEVCWAAFAPVYCQEDKSTIKYLGIISSRWKLYSTPWLDPDTLLMGIKVDRELVKTEEALAVLKVTDWAVCG